MQHRLYDGYTEEDNAKLWRIHIASGEDPFRECEGGTYDRIRHWINSLSESNGFRLLDGGCGEGVTSVVALDSLPDNATVVGVDISDPLIEYARLRVHPRLNFRIGDLAALPFEGASFHHAMAINTIFHMTPIQLWLSLRELARVTGENSHVLLTNVNYNAYPDFEDAFEVKERGVLSCKFLPDETPYIWGNPTIVGPDKTDIVLTNTPFVKHSERNIHAAIQNGGFRIVKEITFAPLSLVGGPKKPLFRAIWLEKI